MRRLPVLALLVILGCSSSSPTTTTSGSETTTSTAPPTSTSSPGTAATALEPPELPDPEDLAAAALDGLRIDGFDRGDVDSDLLETVRLRLTIFSGSYAWAQEEWVGDGEVVVSSLYPPGVARGDPSLPTAFAEAIAEAGGTFRTPTNRDIEGREVVEVDEDEVSWLLWANNTHLFVAAGTGDAVADAMGAVIAHAAGTEYRWAAGDCLYFDDGVPYAPFGDANVVECRGPHSWEVTGAGPLPDDLDDPFPGDELSERVGADCEEAFFDFVGVLPIDSPLNQVFYLPDEAEWAQGDRYYACIIGRNAGAGDTELVAGTLAGAADTVARTIGDCYRHVVDVGVVDCGSAHVFEYIGVAAYPGEADAEYPGGQQLADAFDGACADLVSEYSAEPVVEGAEVTPFPLGFGAFAWESGVRAVPCFAYATDEGVALEVVGSFSGGWGPLGEVGGSVQA